MDAEMLADAEDAAQTLEDEEEKRMTLADLAHGRRRRRKEEKRRIAAEAEDAGCTDM